MGAHPFGARAFACPRRGHTRQGMQKQKILVAEDDDTTRKLIGRQLVMDDYRILFAAEGRETLAVLAQQHPDLVVLDLFMPGVDGMEIIRQVREESVVPIIVLSGAADEETKLRAFALGADDYIV